MEVVSQTLREFGSETSISGINNSAKGNSRIRSSIWLTVFAVLAYFTVAGIYDIVLEFFEYPVITNTDLTYKSEVDFPAVTICNLNRVNCHNAFQAMYDIRSTIASNSSLGREELEELEETLVKLETLVSTNVTDCMYPICISLQSQVGQIRNNDTDEQLIILLESKCPLDTDQEKMYCNFLLEIKDDNEPKDVINGKADELFSSMGCTVTFACSYCLKPQSGKDSKQEPGSQDKQTCLNTKPASCQTIEKEVSTTAQGQDKAENAPEGKSDSNSNTSADISTSLKSQEPEETTSTNKNEGTKTSGNISSTENPESKTSISTNDSLIINQTTITIEEARKEASAQTNETIKDGTTEGIATETKISASNETLSVNTSTYIIEGSSDSKQNIPLVRQKRQGGPPNGPNEGPKDSTKSVDFDSDARFVKRMMDILPKYR